MYGAWTQFPQHSPQDGEAIVVLENSYQDIESILHGPRIEASVAVFRSGYIHDQHGGYRALVPGQWWTSLPPASARG